MRPIFFVCCLLPASASAASWSLWADLSEQHKAPNTTVAVAPVVENDKLFVFLTDTSGNIHFASSTDGKAFGNWSKIDGLTTSFTVAPVAIVGTDLCVFATRTKDHAIMGSCSKDSPHQIWSPWQGLQGITDSSGNPTNADATSAPSAAFYSGSLFVFAVLEGGNSVSVANGIKSTSKGFVAGGWSTLTQRTSKVAPAPVIVGPRLFVAWNSAAGGMFVSRYQPPVPGTPLPDPTSGYWGAWIQLAENDQAGPPGPTVLPAPMTSDVSPAAAVMANDLWFVMKGSDKRVYLSSMPIFGNDVDTNHFSGWYEAPPVPFPTAPPKSNHGKEMTTDAAIGAVHFKDNLFLFATGPDKHVYEEHILPYSFPFLTDGKWVVSTGSWDDPSTNRHPGPPSVTGVEQAYALDITHPPGGEVHAALEGTVIVTWHAERYTCFCEGTCTSSFIGVDGKKVDCVGPGNFVLIRHADNTVTSYPHMQYHSLTVKPNDHVVQGQLIGFSDNTGCSTTPHLHFDNRQFIQWNDGNFQAKLDGPTMPSYFIYPPDTHLPSPWRPYIDYSIPVAPQCQNGQACGKPSPQGGWTGLQCGKVPSGGCSGCAKDKCVGGMCCTRGICECDGYRTCGGGDCSKICHPRD
jgi:murein DD-endopeptidase MepM/ murein hydrolase activator NlpD